jgi:hypothetical protein
MKRNGPASEAFFLSHLEERNVYIDGYQTSLKRSETMKRLRIVLALFVFSAVAFLASAPAVNADEVIVFNGDTYAAIAYSPATGNYGYGYNYVSRGSAEAAAIRNCKANDARIVTWVNNGWCALALGDDKTAWGVGWSYGNGATNTFAKRTAENECGKRTTNPRLIVCVCSTNVAPEKP